MGKRDYGEGALFKRADGVWIGRMELPPGPDGVRRRRTVSSRDRNTAARRLRELRDDVRAGNIAVTGSTTLEKWLQRWLDEIVVYRKLRPTTLDDYRAVIRNHITPAIGHKRLDKLLPQHVREMHKAIGPTRTAEVAHVVLRRALKDAVREGMITRNVAEVVDRPIYQKSKRTEMAVPLAMHVIKTGFTSCDISQATRWAAAFLTGARQGELLGLRWEYVNLDDGYMDLDWQLQQLTQAHGCGGQCGKVKAAYCPQRRWELPPNFEYEPCYRSLVFTRPKTEAGRRFIPIVAPLLVKLRELSEQPTVNPHGLVWHYPDGRPIGPREDNRAWNRLLVEAGVVQPGDTLPLHVARHTTATLLRAAGVDEQTRMELIGHSSVQAQRGYAHADLERHRQAMSSLAELLS